MRNPLVDAAADVITALNALALRRSAHIRGDGEGGLLIKSPAKPELHLTYAAAREFAGKVREAESE